MIQLQTAIEDDQNNNWSTYFNIKVNAPNTSATELWIEDDQFGNDNGRLDPGEILSIYFPTKNSGHADHNNLITNITSSHPGIQFFNATFHLDSLKASATSDAIFNAIIDSSIGYGTPVTFTLSSFTTTLDGFLLPIGVISTPPPGIALISSGPASPTR